MQEPMKAAMNMYEHANPQPAAHHHAPLAGLVMSLRLHQSMKE
ncbi:hypothetical protein [Arthrobacter sp. M4]|nr:hypothetical protein [Arthrobacter sp. M4]